MHFELHAEHVCCHFFTVFSLHFYDLVHVKWQRTGHCYSKSYCCSGSVFFSLRNFCVVRVHIDWSDRVCYTVSISAQRSAGHLLVLIFVWKQFFSLCMWKVVCCSWYVCLVMFVLLVFLSLFLTGWCIVFIRSHIGLLEVDFLHRKMTFVSFSTLKWPSETLHLAYLPHLISFRIVDR